MITKTDKEILDWLTNNDVTLIKQIYGIIIRWLNDKVIIDGRYNITTEYKVMWGYDLRDAVTRILNASN